MKKKIVISLVFVNTYIASFELWSKRAIITWLPYILQMDAFTSSSRSFTSRFNPKHWKLNACSLHHACYLVQWGATYQNSRCVLNKSANDDWKLQLDMTQTSQFSWEITYRLSWLPGMGHFSAFFGLKAIQIVFAGCCCCKHRHPIVKS